MTSAPVTLLIGPVASDKTTRAYTEFRRVRAGRALLLVPGSTQRTAARAALELATPAEVRRVATLGEFAQRILRYGGQYSIRLGPLARQMLIRARVRDLLEQGRLPTLQEVALKPGMLANLGELLRELFSNEVDLAQLGAAGVLPYDGELAVLAHSYRDHLTRHCLSDDEQRLALAIDAIRATPDRIRWLHLLVLDSFDQFTPQQISLLIALAQRGVRLLITLTGDERDHPALIRFERTRATLRTAFAQAGVPISEETSQPATSTASTKPHEAAIAHLRQHLFRLESCAPQPADGLLHVIKAADREREVRAVLRQVHLELAAGTAPTAIGILLRRAAPPYTALLREVATEYGIPLSIAVGRPLLESTAAVARLALLRLPLENYPLAGLAELWRSVADARLPAELLPPACATLPDPLTSYEQVASLLDRLGWQHGVTAGMHHIIAVLEHLASQPSAATPAAPADGDEEEPIDRKLTLSPPQATALLQLVQAVQDWLAVPPSASFAEHIAWVRARTLLPHTTPTDPAVQVWQQLLAALDEAAQLANEPDLPFSAFLGELQAVLRGATYRPATPEQAVQVLAVTAARGQQFEVVALLGLLDGEFPRIAPEPLFYNRAERTLLRSRGLALPLPYPADERTIFYEAVTRATRCLILSYPYLDERGNQLTPSPYVAATTALYLPDSISSEHIRAGSLPTPETAVSHAEARIALLVTPPDQLPDPLPPLLAAVADEPLYDLLKRAQAVERTREGTAGYTHHEGMLDDPTLISRLQRQFDTSHVWSVTRLNDYITCPFRFAAAHLLRLQTPRTQQDRSGLERAGVGRLYHTILQHAGTEWQRRKLTLEPGQADAVLEVLQQAIDAVLARAPTDYGFAPGVFWEWEKQDVARRLLRAVRLMLATAKPDSAPQIAAVEQIFGMEHGIPPLELDTPAGRIRIQGRIDRIDQYPDRSLAVVDYKSGSASRSKEDLESARDVQAAVYLWAVQELLAPAGQAVRHARYFQLGSGKYSTRVEPSAAVAAALRSRLASVLWGVQAGDFSVRPLDQCPPACLFMSICRRNLRKRDAQLTPPSS